jgi:hypothetical protein
MSIHYGICHGPVDSISAIIVKEDRTAWSGTLTAQTKIRLDLMDLFGGDAKEGGIQGYFTYLPGGPSQVMPDELAAKFGLTGATMPGYRGLSSIFFHGSGSEGFLWGQNNPYLVSTWIKATRVAKGLSSSYQSIQVSGGDVEANPAHIIYECLTNTDWGMGLPSSSIDVAAFEAAAVTLYNEQFGLCLLWTKQSSIENFVSEIIDHILATVFVDLKTGLLSIKLIRGDYDSDDLRELTPDNCRITSRQRKAWSETINEIVVTWTNPESEEEETVSVQDNGNIAMQGGIVSDTRNYYGVRRSALAATLAERDLRSASAPLLSAEVEADRSFWDVVPGDVLKLSIPEDGLSDMVVRVGAIDYGKPGSPTIKLSVMEDVFALDSGVWENPPGSAWVDPGEDPTEMTYAQFYTMPIPPLIKAAIVSTDDPDKDYPKVLPGLLAAHSSSDAVNFDLYGEKVRSTGEIYIGNLGTKLMSARATLSSSLVAAATSTVVDPFSDFIGNRPAPTNGDFLVIGSLGDADCEWVAVNTYTEETATYELLRGVYDTVPKDWPAGTPVWVVTFLDSTTDRTERVADGEIDYYLRTRTSLGILPLGSTPLTNFTPTDRPYRPFRPANTSVDGSFFAAKVYEEEPSVVPVAWANRNRLVEDATFARWADSNVTPEDGQTTTIRIETEWGDVLAEHTSLSGTSFSVPYASFDYERNPRVVFLSERDGFESIQGRAEIVTFDLYGYGRNYGNDYGGTLGG